MLVIQIAQYIHSHARVPSNEWNPIWPQIAGTLRLLGRCSCPNAIEPDPWQGGFLLAVPPNCPRSGDYLPNRPRFSVTEGGGEKMAIL